MGANDPARECLAAGLDEASDRLRRAVEEMKNDGLIDPDHSTTAIAYFCQSLLLGAPMLIATGQKERHIPSDDEFAALLETLVGSLAPASRPSS